RAALARLPGSFVWVGRFHWTEVRVAETPASHTSLLGRRLTTFQDGGKPLNDRLASPNERLVVRLHFREKPWDLAAVVGYTVILAPVLLALNVGNLFAILLVLVVPGYVLVAALFPGAATGAKPEIDWIERIALSF